MTATSGNSYHVFVLKVGQEGVERVYIEYTGQTRDEAEKTLKRSQRARVIGYRLARPTSHYREEIAAREARVRDPEAALLTKSKRRFRYKAR